MTTILRFILLFLLAPALAITTQAAGVDQGDFRVNDKGFRVASGLLMVNSAIYAAHGEYIEAGFSALGSVGMGWSAARTATGSVAGLSSAYTTPKWHQGSVSASENFATSFDGVQQASRYLQDIGVPRADRARILQSFEVDAMKVRTAGQSEFGLRYFSDSNRAGGSYLFETFPASRSSLAIKPEWSTMSGFRQFQVRPGATILEGPAAAQGPLLPGGQTQKFILDWRTDLISP